MFIYCFPPFASRFSFLYKTGNYCFRLLVFTACFSFSHLCCPRREKHVSLRERNTILGNVNLLTFNFELNAWGVGEGVVKK